MATFGTTLRRGLPRRPGGEPWPPAGAAPDGVGVVAVAGVDGVEQSLVHGVSVVDGAGATAERAGVSVDGVEQSLVHGVSVVDGAGATAERAGVSVALRRGLPRVPGGEPWPPASAFASVAPAATATTPETAAVPDAGTAPSASRPAGTPAPTSPAAVTAATEPPAAAVIGAELRRGLPRAPGGEPWPPAGIRARALAPSSKSAPDAGVSAETASTTAPGSAEVSTGADAATPTVAASPAAIPAAAAPSAATPTAAIDPAAATDPAAAIDPTAATDPAGGPRAPLTVPRTVWPGRAAFDRPRPKPEPERVGPFTKAQWAGAVIVGGGGLLVAAGLAVAFVRFFLSLPFMADFLAAFPGEYHLPDGAPVGFPAWLGWQHFFNVFLMVLIIRSGLRIRNEKRPSAFWTPRNDPKGKTSLTIWFHQSLDVLWLVNGVVFVVLLFVTGQWMRIIPTSWEVFPNALSAALQYVSLDWPTENGWVNYNSLQQLAYFTTVFVAAPLAAITGYRMSGMWPKENAKLNQAYPIEWARKVHFPVMLYFVVFIFIHVALVFATGALRNLNHMYAAQGSVDGVAYADNWTGFWVFFASLVVIAAAWIAARPLTIAPIARLFGTVSGR